MRQLSNRIVPRAPERTPVEIGETPTLSSSGENAPLTHRTNLSRPLCLPLVAETKKVIWVTSDQVELQEKDQPELEKAFDCFPYLTAEQTVTLAQRCSLHPDQVKVWFMAKRLEYGISWDYEDIREVYGKISARHGDDGNEELQNREKIGRNEDSIKNQGKGKATDSTKEQNVEDRSGRLGPNGTCEEMKQNPEQAQPLRNEKKGKLKENKTKIRKKKSVVDRKKKKQTIEGTAEKTTPQMFKSNTGESTLQDSVLDGTIQTKKLNRTRERPEKDRKKPANKSPPLLDDPLGATSRPSLQFQTELFNVFTQTDNTDPLETSDTLYPAMTNPANSSFDESKDGKTELKEEIENDILVTDIGKLKELIKGSNSPVSDDQTTFPRQQRDKVPHPSQTVGRRKTCIQLSTLKKAFSNCQYPTSELYYHLTKETGLSRSSLVQWFGDMRYYVKKQKPSWMNDEQHKQVLGNIKYRQYINIITKMENKKKV
ncbi:homeobox and leucine zipper protein Homez [Oryzias latipes]|uniref:homeobox and leucine zipper protein Homez n=1 Tax=Oryzias latipes TaxID=8090 RepID=UPI0009D98A0F|nr:homeobox and leucine zipper protein Homez [Oryzias latipes]